MENCLSSLFGKRDLYFLTSRERFYVPFLNFWGLRPNLYYTFLIFTLITILNQYLLDTSERRFVHHAVFSAADQPGMAVHAGDEPVGVSRNRVSRVRFELGRNRVRVGFFRAVEPDNVCIQK